MIIEVNENNILEAATVHSISWKESHRSFCTEEFIEFHSPERQLSYIRNKIDSGSKFYLLIEDAPIGIVSVTDSLIEDLYILPDEQNKGYGTTLLQFAIEKCESTPTLWILENNVNAERLYLRQGFKRTGNVNSITDRLDEIEFALTD